MGEEQELLQALAAKGAREDLQALLALPEGRRFVWGLIEGTGLFAPSFSTEPAVAAYSEGRRSVGIALMLRVQQDAGSRWAEMVQEALERGAGVR